MAGDIAELMTGMLGRASYGMVGHDWGGGIAYALAAAHRDAPSYKGKVGIMEWHEPGLRLEHQ